jgi:NADP-dependent 3-hydroxy acid dehydrogenase YdfG
MNLKDKVAIVTGASSGIGEATARELAQAGAHVVLAARSAERLDELATELDSSATGSMASRRVVALPTDVSDRQAVERMVALTVAAWGRVDVLVNNAGLGLYAQLAEASPESMRYLMDVNYFGTLHCIQAVVPHMKAQGGGTIVNVSSIAGKHINPYQGAYCATKYALIAASDALRVELAPFGIRVLTALPGVTRTEFQTNARRERVAPPSRAGIRGVGPEKVGQAIVKAVRNGGPPEVYATLFDRAYVTFATTFPRLTDRVLMYIVSRRK